MEKRRVLITGASGNIGGKLSKAFKHSYELILLDRKKEGSEEIHFADFSQYDHNWVQHFEGPDTVIHLAANPHTDARWEELIPDNIDSVLNVCEAGVQNSVSRLIFASSCHTMGACKGRNDVELITTEMTPHPCCDYGVSKLIGERICKSYSDRYGMSVICLRIGSVYRKERKPDTGASTWRKSLWLSNRDLVQVFEKAIEAPAIDFAVLYAISGNRGAPWDLKITAAVLGYSPTDGLE